jgi:hypothetical protein
MKNHFVGNVDWDGKYGFDALVGRVNTSRQYNLKSTMKASMTNWPFSFQILTLSNSLLTRIRTIFANFH